MPDAFDDLQRAIDAAEQAAAAGNLAQAEVHLHEVLRLQIHYVGELDPDVAATIHKLAIVNERTGRIAEAEAMYRRAVAVASAVLPASDPLVRQCSEDLTAFLAATAAAEAPVQAPRPAPASASRVGPTPDRAPAPAPVRRDVYAPPAPSSTGMPTWLLAGLGILAALAVVVLIWRSTATTAAPDSSTAATTAPPPTAAPSPGAEPATPAPAARQPEPSASPSAPAPTASPATRTPPPAAAPVVPAPAPSPAPAAPPRAALPAAATTGVEVLDARLCRQLTPSGAWTCVPPENPPAFGRYYYLTRLAAPATLQVEHRWYRGDRLVQSVPLTIRASGGSGFRTYSRQTVPEAQPGEWRVEVRSQQGAVLAEERFTVR
jgi:hypothetical protein